MEHFGPLVPYEVEVLRSEALVTCHTLDAEEHLVSRETLDYSSDWAKGFDDLDPFDPALSIYTGRSFALVIMNLLASYEQLLQKALTNFSVACSPVILAGTDIVYLRLVQSSVSSLSGVIQATVFFETSFLSPMQSS